MGLLPAGYLFSQHGLNTYRRCKRRFLYRYIDRQPWPMPEAEDLSTYLSHLERGRVLHQWVARALLGLPVEPMALAAEDAQLLAWWRAFQRCDLSGLPGPVREVELPVITPLGDWRLYARFDLLALEPGGPAVVVDWKTLAQAPSLRTLSARVQTQVYLYALVATGGVLSGGAPVEPGEAEMRYWFAPSEEWVTIPYSRARYVADGRTLRALAEEIATQPREAFALTEALRECQACTYRSLCERGDATQPAEATAWLEEELDFQLDLDAAEAVEY